MGGGATGTSSASTTERERYEPNASGPEVKTPLPTRQIPDLHGVFKSVSTDLPGVHASQATIDRLGPVERKILGSAPVTLVLSPADVLVKNEKGQVDMAASQTKLADVIANFYPGTALDEADKKNLINGFKEMEAMPQAANVQLEPQACMVQFNPATGAGANGLSRQITGLPDSYIRPDKLAIMNDLFGKYALSHEVGHCKEGTNGNGPKPNPLYVMQLADMMAGEAAADNLARVALNALPSSMMPHKKEGLQAILDQRAINGMLSPGDTYGLHEEKLLLLNDHATIGLLLRPDANPAAAVVAPGMANRSIHHFLGEQALENGVRPQDPDTYRQLTELKTKEPEKYDVIMHVLGREASRQSPLLHYAAAKAMLEEGVFKKDSLAHLNVEQYVKAMERNIKPDLLADAKTLVEPFRDSVRHMPAAEREKLTVTVAKENAEVIALLKDPENRVKPAPVPSPQPDKLPEPPAPPTS
jgi:hypothetical protein